MVGTDPVCIMAEPVAYMGTITVNLEFGKVVEWNQDRSL
jgi:hypothetical protein